MLKKLFFLSSGLLPVGVYMLYIAATAEPLLQPMYFMGAGLILLFVVLFLAVVYAQFTESDH